MYAIRSSGPLPIRRGGQCRAQLARTTKLMRSPCCIFPDLPLASPSPCGESRGEGELPSRYCKVDVLAPVRSARHCRLTLLVLIALSLVATFSALGADLKEAQVLFLSGNYTGCVALARQASTDASDSEEWQLLLSKALLATGQYPEAQTAITNALERERSSARLR